MNKVFLIADLHFGHENIIKYDSLPFKNASAMDKLIIRNWNKVVGKDDTVFVLGDVSFRSKEETAATISSLNGKKILIKGNHDKRSTQWWLDVGFSEASSYPITYKEFFILSHEPPQYFNEDGVKAYFYGHVHGTEMYKTVTSRSACLCALRWDFTPVELEKLIELMKLAS